MTDNVDVVVIGSGPLGSSTAFYLASEGRNVALVDKAEIGSQMSSRAAGLTRQVRSTEMMTVLGGRAIEKFERFTEETGEPLEFIQAGSLTLARTPEHASLMRGATERAQYLGLDVKEISPQEARAMMPLLETQGILAVGFARKDIYTEPAQLAPAYARAAARRGAMLLPNTEVHELVVESGVVSRVVTGRGEIRTTAVVDAAGGWLRLVAGLAGACVPEVARLHHMMISVSLPQAVSPQPVVHILDANAYVRSDQGGLMFGGYEDLPRQLGPGEALRNLSGEHLQADLSAARALVGRIHGQFPVLRDIALRECRSDLTTTTVDCDHIFGPAPSVKGLYVLGGRDIDGFSISPVLGELLAHWIVTGQAPMDLSSMNPARFAANLCDTEMIKQTGRLYANYYAA
ncbi:NAD(P)/FAD-dependent oxidoreductase [Variovorax sp. AFSI2.2]|uniref:NAD(P)/FAD-dependent oxidoreductase n=1 Tax=Variovorax sp. AFSI2.2 TaxID=3384160 RepID=UPI003EC0AE26